MSKFTAGPWRILPHRKGCKIEIWGDTATPVAYLKPRKNDLYDNHAKQSEANANAQLIASAPELFEQLRVMTALCRLKYDGTDPAFMAEILESEAVISKARGEI